ncbi:GNAT family N-acetyltransferase [Algoriphagus aquatilis]|uniref:GNAT family N-acetyltransferase n=1 Tax=Algoriphagus aquatilis TaxID=490186 RepID=A0ABW0BVR1_9BACT
MRLRLEKITDNSLLREAFAIRNQVFVLEQNVDPALERDDFEATSHHFIAFLEEIPVGAARWRVTDYGVKLERFAVLREFRGKGIGQALVSEVLKDIAANPEAAGKIKYLHAQLSAMGLYSKFGFEKVGDLFEECFIQHYKMQLA